MSTRPQDPATRRARDNAEAEAVRPLVTLPETACKRCLGHTFERIPRYGFWQSSVLPFFNLYPWRCVSCAKVLYRTARIVRRTDRPGM